MNFFSFVSSKKTILGIGGSLCAGLFLWANGNLSHLSASLFTKNPDTLQSGVELYIESAIAKRGETGELAIKINKAMTMQGFSFEISYPAEMMIANGFSTEGTSIAGKNFLIQDNRTTNGVIKVAGVGSSSASFAAGDTLLLLSFSLKNNISESTTSLPISFRTASVVDNSGTEKTMTTQNASIKLSSGAQLSITKITPSAKGTIVVEFSDILAGNLVLGCAQFSEQVITSSSHLKQNANVLTFSGLALLPGKGYVISFNTTVQSSQGVALHPAQQKIYFVVPNDGVTPDVNYDANLGITSVSATNLTNLDLVMSSVPTGDVFMPSSLQIKNNNETITINKITQNSADKRIFHISTSAMQADTPYMFLMNPSTWKTSTGKMAGGTLSKLFWTEDLSPLPNITNVSPYRPVQGVNTTITISGNNLPTDAKVLVNGVLLLGTQISEDKKTITAVLPSNLQNGSYTLEIQYTKNSESKSLFMENALVVEARKEKEVQVISSKSYSSPLKVPNDGTTTTKLFVYVDDPRGLADLEKVTADLRVIHGNAAESLKPGPIENGQQVWFLENIKVPNTVQTKTAPYAIPVVAQNRAGITGEGTVLLWVSRDTTSSVPPRIVNFTVTPSTIVAGNKNHSVLLAAEISDEDSGEEVTTVAVDMSSVGVNTIFLTARNLGQSTGKTKFFENATPIVVSSEIPNGTYPIRLKVIDAQGDEASLEKTITITRQSNLGPSMDNTNTYVTPSRSLIKDGKFSFAIHTKVTDPSGADNIASVSLNLAPLGLPPVIMNAGAKEGLSQWYSSSALYLPDAVAIGKKKLLVSATDKEGNSYEQDVWVEVMYQQDTGKPPVIDNAQNYITPTKAINDGKTPFSGYVFVKDPDDNVSHVVLKLENTAIYNGSTLPKGISNVDSSGDETCVSTRTLLCMQPILKEAGGQWYYLSDIIVPSTTAARDTPYALEVNAFDKTGKMAQGKLNVVVSSPNNITLDGQNEILYLQATSANALQMVVKNPIDPKTFKSSWLNISAASNGSDLLSVGTVDISPDGKLLTIQTNPQIPGKAYAMKVDAESMGVRFTDLSSQVYPFLGFQVPEKSTSFRLTGVKAVSSTQINLSFSIPLNATSILNPSSVEIFLEGKKEKLEVKGLQIADPKTLAIITAPQTAGQRYDLYYKGISSLYGDSITKKQSTKLEAFKQGIGTTVGGLQATADFNSDGIVDFKDFTLFAAVYGKTYDQAASGDLNGDSSVDFKDFTMFSSLYGEVLDTPSSNKPSASASPTNSSLLVPSQSSSATNTSPSATPTPTPTPSIFPSSFIVSPTASASANTPSPTPLPTFHYSATTATASPTPAVTSTSTSNTTTTSSTTTTTPSATATPSPTPACTGDQLYCLLAG